MSGCRCPSCFGLAEYMHELTGRDYGIPPARPRGQATLHVQTLGRSRTIACNGTMTCPCDRCVGERLARPALGAGGAQLVPRPSRYARTAGA